MGLLFLSPMYEVSNRETATRFLQVCAFPVVDVYWRAPAVIDGYVPVGTVVAVSNARGRN